MQDMYIYIVCFMVQTLERAQHELQTTRPFVKYPNVYYLSYQSALAKVISVNIGTRCTGVRPKLAEDHLLSVY